jgi:aryl-alcohol dehydrogenase-like predicted oxidoreductase
MIPEVARQILDMALGHGINYFDTANVYNRGESEEWLGTLLKARGVRTRCVISTKFGYRTNPVGESHGGSGRPTMMRAVEASLRRLKTDYIDVYYLHLWDGTTPVEETLQAATELVEQGKIRHFALSNVPSWYFARADCLAACHGWAPPVAIQLNYNLLTRAMEPEFDSMLAVTRAGLVSWGPLANGLLAGRYVVDRETRTVCGRGRITEAVFSTGHVDPYAEHVERVRRELDALSQETGHPHAVLAIGWLLARPRVVSVLLGISSPAQLLENLGAPSVLNDDVLRRLDRASEVPTQPPYGFLGSELLDTLVRPRAERPDR